MTTFLNQTLNQHVTVDLRKILSLVTVGLVFQVITRKEYVVRLDHTVTAIPTASHLLTRVAARTVKTLTGLGASEDPMHAFRVASCFTAVTAIIKTSIARKLTSSLGTQSLEVIWRKGLKICIAVSLCRGQHNLKTLPTAPFAPNKPMTSFTLVCVNTFQNFRSSKDRAERG